jgi:PAS domain S-box-containing protein
MAGQNASSHIRDLRSSAIAGYGVSALSVAAALLVLQWTGASWQFPAYVSFFLAAVMVSAWFGGLGPGLLATALSGLALAYALFPNQPLAIGASELPHLVSFGLAALLITLLSASQRRATESLRRVRDELKGSNRLLQAEIIEHSRSEEALRWSERLFHAIVEDQGEMIVRWKPDGTRTFVNQAYCRVFGKSYDELVGTNFWPLVAEPYREREQERIRRLTPQSPYSMAVHESLLPDGSTQWQEWSDRGFFDERGHLVELQSVGRDISERIQGKRSFANPSRISAPSPRSHFKVSPSFRIRESSMPTQLNRPSRVTPPLSSAPCPSSKSSPSAILRIALWRRRESEGGWPVRRSPSTSN